MIYFIVLSCISSFGNLTLKGVVCGCTRCLNSPAAYASYKRSKELSRTKFITGQNEREETTQDAIVTKSAAFASYEINYLTYITATYTRAKRRWQTIKEILLLVKATNQFMQLMQATKPLPV
jgi:hypothetical protein